MLGALELGFDLGELADGAPVPSADGPEARNLGLERSRLAVELFVAQDPLEDVAFEGLATTVLLDAGEKARRRPQRSLLNTHVIEALVEDMASPLDVGEVGVAQDLVLHVGAGVPQGGDGGLGVSDGWPQGAGGSRPSTSWG